MKVGFIQYDVVHGDKKRNFEKVSDMINGDCALLVLPELSFTGYLFSRDELLPLAENVPGGETERLLLKLSAEKKCTVIAGIAEKEGEIIYNTAIIVSKGKYIGKYRKIHLSDYEKTLFARGDENNVFDIEGVRVGVQICFDLWFPEVSRKQVLDGADILCALANFGGETTPKIARVRAVENQIPLILCNRVGHEEAGGIDADFLGGSMIIGPDGEPLVQGADGNEEFVFTEIPPRQKGNVICGDFIKEIQIHYQNASN